MSLEKNEYRRKERNFLKERYMFITRDLLEVSLIKAVSRKKNREQEHGFKCEDTWAKRCLISLPFVV